MKRNVVIIQHEARVPAAKLLPLGSAKTTIIVGADGDQIPTDTQGIDGLIVLGGSMSAREPATHAWLQPTIELLAAACQQDIPTLGVCLGAQLLAVATGGRVELGDNGPELGIVEITATAEAANDPFFRHLPTRFPAAQSHFDAVTSLTSDAVVLAGSQSYPHQAFRVGHRAWGVQYHPEVTEDQYLDWMEADADDLHGQGTSVDEVMRSYRRHAPTLDLIARSHSDAFWHIVAGG